MKKKFQAELQAGHQQDAVEVPLIQAKPGGLFRNDYGVGARVTRFWRT
jgi:hypothetical protein